MSEKTLTFTVEDGKVRLDKFLASKVAELSQSETSQTLSRGKIQKDIQAGAVSVNGQIVDLQKHILKDGDQVTYQPLEEEKPEPVNIPLNILYQQDGLLLLDKPAGLAVHPGAGLKEESLAQGLLYHFKDIVDVGEEDRHGIVHRLDKQTSGVMAVALTPAMYEYLKKQFSERTVKKEYLALVCGRLKPEHGFIEKSLGKSKRDFRKYTTEVEDMVREKPSKTEYQVLEYLEDRTRGGLDEYTLIAVKLHTGRTHQIRVHFNSIGFPLVGDKLYGGKQAAKLGFSRQALHAWRLEIPLQNKRSVTGESKLPEDFKKLLIRLNSKKVNTL